MGQHCVFLTICACCFIYNKCICSGNKTLFNNMTALIWLLYIFIFSSSVYGAKREQHKVTNQLTDRTVIVQLFEWKWLDIADECERFLGPSGYGAVQTSPASENLIIHLQDGTRPWYERYQVMSYKLQTRSGSEEDFLNMTTRCNRVGVRIYVDVVFNHMTGDHETNIGTAGSTADFANFHYPAVPYARGSFHNPDCDINNYDNATEVRDCKLVGLKDLNQTMPCVRQKIVAYLNKLVSLGVAGFRVDAAKHMWPADLLQIYSSVNNLSTEFGFPPNSKPFVYQEVSQGGAVSPFEYNKLGSVTEFKTVAVLFEIFTGQKLLSSLVSWGNETWNMIPSGTALVFVDNHDTQRSTTSLNYKYGAKYRAAVAFLLAHRYGHARITSSFYFNNTDQGPPSDSEENILAPVIKKDGSCGGGWVCEHRWKPISRMVNFRNTVHGTKVRRWWSNGKNQIAFSRGRRGFIAFSIKSRPMNVTLQTGLPAGTYCDIRSGQTNGQTCTGKTITVSERGLAQMTLSGSGDDLYLAIHIGSDSRLQL